MPSPKMPWPLAAALLAPALDAQSILLPNYERIRVGQREALEGGAYVARTSDTVAGWYNPAGLALSPKSGLNASATAEEWLRFRFGGATAEVARARLQSIGTFVGGVLGPPVIKSDRWRLGFSFSRPVSWRPSGINTAFSSTVPGGDELLDYASEVEFSTWVPALGVGYKASDALRLGLRVAGAVTHLSEDESVADRLTRRGVGPRSPSGSARPTATSTTCSCRAACSGTSRGRSRWALTSPLPASASGGAASWRFSGPPSPIPARST